jgi:hypothetical protein
MLPAEPPVINRLLGRTLLLLLSGNPCLRVIRLTPRKRKCSKSPRSFSRVCRTMMFVQLFFRRWGEASR